MEILGAVVTIDIQTIIGGVLIGAIILILTIKEIYGAIYRRIYIRRNKCPREYCQNELFLTSEWHSFDKQMHPIARCTKCDYKKLL